MRDKNSYKEQNRKTFISTIDRIYRLCSPTSDSIVHCLENELPCEIYENTAMTEHQFELLINDLIEQNNVIIVTNEGGYLEPIPVKWFKMIINYYFQRNKFNDGNYNYGSLFYFIQSHCGVGQVTARAIIHWLEENHFSV